MAKSTTKTAPTVGGTSVVVEDTRTGVVRTYTSNESGAFLATNLGVGGPYRVTVGGTKSVMVDSVALGETYNLTINMQSAASIEEIVVIGDSRARRHSSRTIRDVFVLRHGNRGRLRSRHQRGLRDRPTDEPGRRRLRDELRRTTPALQQHHDGWCQPERPLRFRTATVIQRQPACHSPTVGIEQIAVELAPFDVTYGGFSACNINVVSKSGTDEWSGERILPIHQR